MAVSMVRTGRRAQNKREAKGAGRSALPRDTRPAGAAKSHSLVVHLHVLSIDTSNSIPATHLLVKPDVVNVEDSVLINIGFVEQVVQFINELRVHPRQLD